MSPSDSQPTTFDPQLFTGHSAFQIEHFIATRGNWTAWGKLQQARREIRNRLRADSQLRDEIALAQIERVETRRRWCLRDTSRRRREIRMRQLDARIEELNANLGVNSRELAEFERIAHECSAQIGEVTPERGTELDAETWQVRIRAMAAIDVLTRGGVSSSTLELICALDQSMRQSILTEIRTAVESGRDQAERKLLGWLDNLSPPLLRELEPLPNGGTHLPTLEPRSRGS